MCTFSSLQNGEPKCSLPTYYAFWFKKKAKNGSQTCNKLCSVYGKDAVTTRKCQENKFLDRNRLNQCVKDSSKNEITVFKT